jgi:hypothetical protein
MNESEKLADNFSADADGFGSSSKIGDTGPKMNNGTHVPT